MTTDYSALANAELLAAWDNETGNAKWLAQREMAKRLREYPLGSDPFRLIVALDAARAEAQRLRRERDELIDYLTTPKSRHIWGPEIEATITMSYADYRAMFALIARILTEAAEDASAQGGE